MLENRDGLVDGWSLTALRPTPWTKPRPARAFSATACALESAATYRSIPLPSGTLPAMDANGLLASLFISSIGLVTFLYGKKQARLPQMAIGVVLLVYTYFLSSIVWMFVIAAALLALLWFVVRLGW